MEIAINDCFQSQYEAAASVRNENEGDDKEPVRSRAFIIEHRNEIKKVYEALQRQLEEEETKTAESD